MQKMLTKKQKKIYDFVTSFIEKKDYSPSLKEIGGHFKLAVSTIYEHIEGIKSKGYLKKRKKHARSIEPKIKADNNFFSIPILGTIAAGQPIETIEIPNETIQLSKNEVSKFGNYYALRVRGESMIDDGIFDGDIVVIKQQSCADNGQTVVAVINENEATLKKIYREKNRIKLQPANQTMIPFYTKDIEVRGAVVKIIRNFEGQKQNKVFSIEERKEIFLNKIRSINPKSRNKYKRVVVTPLRYAGGKSLAVGYIVELLPNNIKRLISPFFGGGSVEIACNKYLGLKIIGYEIFDILVNYWNMQINKPEALFKKLSKLNPDAATYKKIKGTLKEYWQKKRKLSQLDLATHYYFNHNLSYGPGFLGWPSKIYLNKKRYHAIIKKVRDFSVNNFEVKCASFEEAFKKYPNDFFYCDPPYLLGEDTKMFRGIYPMRNIPIHHNGFPHEELRDLLKNHKGGFILSYNNCQRIRGWYSKYQQYFPEWQYTMGQGETRIGSNRVRNGTNSHIKESHEILIYCSPEI